jgi:hypothetical protein
MPGAGKTKETKIASARLAGGRDCRQSFLLTGPMRGSRPARPVTAFLLKCEGQGEKPGISCAMRQVFAAAPNPLPTWMGT